MQVVRIANIMIAIKILVVLVFCAFNEVQGGAKCSNAAEEIDWCLIGEKQWFLNLRTEQAPPRFLSVCTSFGNPIMTSTDEVTIGTYLFMDEDGIASKNRLTLRRHRPGVYTFVRDEQTLQAFGLDSSVKWRDLPRRSVQRRLFTEEFIITTNRVNYMLITECDDTEENTVSLIFTDEPNPPLRKLTAALNGLPVPSKSPLVVTPCEDLTIDLHSAKE